MYNKKMYELGSKRSVIRELFEFGKTRAEKMGKEKVFDFSIGNPNVPAPDEVNAAVKKYASTEDSVAVHGYTSAQGDYSVRKTIADHINKDNNSSFAADDVYMTCGAAAALTITLNALYEDGDEIIAFAPFFPEYRVFAENAGFTFVTVPFTEPDFQMDFTALERALNEKTKAVIVNSPNNPSGVVYSESTIKKLSDLLRKKSKEYGKEIFIIADEPYRELVYDGVTVPFIPSYYDNTIVCYSYSKSLSLPGERIGYVAVNPQSCDNRGLYAAICGAGRALGYVCAPSLMQYVVRDCIDCKADVASYKRNRDLLYGGLVSLGYTCARPDGAFYLFVRSPENDTNAFCERAKDLGLLLVSASSFAAPDYVRIAYCVDYDLIKRAMPLFKTLIESYKK